MNVLFLLFSACSGGDEPVDLPKPTAASGVPADVIGATWQVRMAKAEARAPFEGRPSWIAYYEGRRAEALAAFKSESDGAALARAHAEYAALYRQAALLAANAVLQVYGADRQPSDPAEVEYLLGVSGMLTRQVDFATHLGMNTKSGVADIARRDGSWKGWSAAPTEWPDEPAGVATVVGNPGELPGGTLATVALPLVGEPGAVDSGDPADLYALSRWHEAQARAADPAASPAVDGVLDPFRLPFEAHHPAPAAYADTWLFMSAYTSAADMQFVSLTTAGDTAGALALASQSAYAAIAKVCAPEKTVDVDCVVEQAAELGTAIEAGMATQNGGAADGFHRPFADYARAGALRALDLFARVSGQDDASGRLRINAFDRSIEHAADPTFLMFLAAWDTGNRNTVRATELVHQQITTVPGLVVARAPLDALHIRLSRNAAPGVPTH